LFVSFVSVFTEELIMSPEREKLAVAARKLGGVYKMMRDPIIPSWPWDCARFENRGPAETFLEIVKAAGFHTYAEFSDFRFVVRVA
jgi:hypothetical protein